MDFLTIDVVHTTTDLKEIYRHVDKDHWKDIAYSAMEQTTAEFSSPQEVLNKIHRKQLAIEYGCFFSFYSRDSTMHLYNPSYNFDSIFVFNLHDKMKHFKEQASPVGNLEEECLIKDNNIKEFLKQITWLQKAVVDNQFKANKIIKEKEEMYAELSKEFDRINDEYGK